MAVAREHRRDVHVERCKDRVTRCGGHQAELARSEGWRGPRSVSFSLHQRENTNIKQLTGPSGMNNVEVAVLLTMAPKSTCSELLQIPPRGFEQQQRHRS